MVPTPHTARIRRLKRFEGFAIHRGELSNHQGQDLMDASFLPNDLAFTRGRRTPASRTSAAQPRRPSGATLCYAHAPITLRSSSCHRWHQKVYAHPGKLAMPKSAPRRAGAARRHQGGATSSTGRAATWGRNRSTAHADQVSSQSLFRNHRPSVANARAAPWGAQTEPQPPVGARSADQTRLQFGGRTASQVTVPRRPPMQNDKLHTRTMHLVHDGRIRITTSVHARALNADLSLYRRPTPATGA